MRKDRAHIAYSVIAPPVPSGAFLRINDNVYMASPELCYVQMADYLTPLQLAKYGMELCGYYRYDSHKHRFVDKNASLTSVDRVNAFLDAYSGRRGAGRGKDAAYWLMDGSASIRESQLALHFRVGRRAGGNGIGVPELNYEVKLSPEIQRIAGKRHYYLDQYWEAGNLACEYESGSIHNEPKQADKDRKRRNILQHVGYRVITVNTNQLSNIVELDAIAAQIAKCIGKRQRPLGEAYRRKHFDFHQELMHVDERFHL